MHICLAFVVAVVGNVLEPHATIKGPCQGRGVFFVFFSSLAGRVKARTGRTGLGIST